jgi:hypothetical protein
MSALSAPYDRSWDWRDRSPDRHDRSRFLVINELIANGTAIRRGSTLPKVADMALRRLADEGNRSRSAIG